MKSIHFLAALALSISNLAYAAGGHDHGIDHKPVHGGIVVEANHMDFELLAKPDSIQLFVRDHGKPVDVSQVSAKAVMLYGSDKSEVDLKPVGDKLEARGVFKVSSGTKVVTTVVFSGNKTSTARFAIK